MKQESHRRAGDPWQALDDESTLEEFLPRQRSTSPPPHSSSRSLGRSSTTSTSASAKTRSKRKERLEASDARPAARQRYSFDSSKARSDGESGHHLDSEDDSSRSGSDSEDDVEGLGDAGGEGGRALADLPKTHLFWRVKAISDTKSGRILTKVRCILPRCCLS